MPCVTVILTSYNRDTLLRAAIQSVVAQTCTDWELFIMDDDSDNPKTIEVLDEQERRSKMEDGRSVNVFREKLAGVDRFSRTGYAVNINKALARAEGEFITYLTCDDIFYPDRLERMVAHLRAHPDQMVCYGVQQLARILPDGTIQRGGLRDEGPVVKSAACRIDHNSVMHRRECVEICGRPLWPENPEVIGCADAGVWQKFEAQGWAFHRVAGGPTDEHRLHKNSIQKL
jgi:glycosyltransferase involved in cell wall biosynthesis